MRCSKCNEYVPEGLGIKECPICGGELQEKSEKPAEEKNILESKRPLDENIYDDDSDITRKTICGIGALINVVIAIYCFQFLGSGGCVATSLTRFGNSIKIIVIGIAFVYFLSLLLRWIYKYWNNIYISIMSWTLMLAMSFAYGYICMSIVRPLAEKNAKKTEKVAKKMLKGADLFLPDEEFVLRDKNALKQGVKYLLLSFNEKSGYFADMNDSLRFFYINELLGRDHNFRNITNLDIEITSEKLQCDFILYSPDYQHFFAVLTYGKHFYHNGLILFCKREEETIDIYSYADCYSQYNLSGKDYLFGAITSDFNIRTLKTDEFSEYPHPFKKDFWYDKYFFSVITIQDENYLRYQTKLWYNRSEDKYEYAARPMFRIRFD